jgi:dienelactone hydrolase
VVEHPPKCQLLFFIQIIPPMPRYLFPLFALFLIVPQLVRAADETPTRRIKIARAVVDCMMKERFNDAVRYFDRTLRAHLPADTLAAVWTELIAQNTFGGVDTVRAQHSGGSDTVVVRLRLATSFIDVSVLFHESDRVAGLLAAPVVPLYRTPSYADSALFTERLVTVGSSPFVLHGRLSVPKGDGPFPCVVLVHGSGPNDKDETIGGNKVFKDIAWGLSSQGIAVLRYEKRTREYAAQCATNDTLTVYTEVIDDACAAIEVARRAGRIDPARVFLLGHSLGATVAPRIAAINNHLAGVILLAGVARPIEDAILDQSTYLVSLGAQSKEAMTFLKQLRQQVECVKSPSLSPATPSSKLPLSWNASYWLDLRAHDPAQEAAALAIPLLLLHGGRDYQVTGADVALWKRSLKAKQNARYVEYADLNHLFMPGTGKSTPDEYIKPGNVGKIVIEDIAKWVNSGGTL